MIEYILYKGETYPIRISFYALKMYRSETKKELEAFDLEDLEVLFYYALIAGHKAENKEMPFKREDIAFVLDEVFVDFKKLLPKFMGVISDVETSQDNGAKKK